jgi:hypothetical protein
VSNFIRWIIRAIAHYLAKQWAEAQALARGRTEGEARAIGWIAGAAAAFLVGAVLS